MGNSFQQQVPVLPVVIPLGVVVFGLLLWRLKAKGIFSVPRALVAAALGLYAAGIVANSVFPIFLDPIDKQNPFTDFEEWAHGVVLIPFVKYGIEDAIINVVVFAPLGVILSLLLASPSWWKVLLAATGASLVIELAQLTVMGSFGGGHVADASDMVCNVIGGMLGYALLLLLTRIPWFARFAERFRWSPTRPATAAPAPVAAEA